MSNRQGKKPAVTPGDVAASTTTESRIAEAKNADAGVTQAETGSRTTEPIDVASMRIDYDLGGLRRSDLEDHPADLFAVWLKEAVASNQPEPTAMTLATADADGTPSSRIVLLKGFDHQSFRFFTNYASRKGRQLDANPRASLTFFWPLLQRQVRIEGSVDRLPREDSLEYFSSRPYRSQLAAWCSPQSQPIADRAELESRWQEAENRFAGREVELPETWGGYGLRPELFEFWQGRRSRLHDRFRMTRSTAGGGDRWRIERLAP